MIGKALIVVPHGDDELNIAGSLFEDMHESNVEVHILFVTRCDFGKMNYEKRKREMENVAKIYGIKKSYIFNFEDSNVSKCHIFNNPLTRNSLKQKMQEVILDVNADLIVCVDFDSHPDHIMCTQLFDQIIAEQMVASNYRPIVLKKFSYLGVWGGNPDFFGEKEEVTKPFLEDRTESEYTLCLPNSWDDRLRFATRKEDISLKFWKSKLFKAYCSYLTQMGIFFFKKAVNADAVYWYRNTSNLAIGQSVHIKASSGNTKYLNDFALAQVKRITDHSYAAELFSECAWVPEEQDTKKEFTLWWQDGTVTVSSIKLYQNFQTEGHIDSFMLEFSNGFKKECQCESDDAVYLDFEEQHDISWVRFSIISGVGRCGVREFEVYEVQENFLGQKYRSDSIGKMRVALSVEGSFSQSWFMSCTGYTTEQLTRSEHLWDWLIGVN